VLVKRKRNGNQNENTPPSNRFQSPLNRLSDVSLSPALEMDAVRSAMANRYSNRLEDRLSPTTLAALATDLDLGMGNPLFDFPDQKSFGGRRRSFRLAESLDVDRMSYEELLALQEKVGFVSKGAKAEHIEQLPTSKFRAASTLSSSVSSSSSSSSSATPRTSSSVSKNETDETKKNCNICLNDFEDGDDIRSLPCFHFFHREEIDQWLSLRDTCPVCQTPATRNAIS